MRLQEVRRGQWRAPDSARLERAATLPTSGCCHPEPQHLGRGPPECTSGSEVPDCPRLLTTPTATSWDTPKVVPSPPKFRGEDRPVHGTTHELVPRPCEARWTASRRFLPPRPITSDVGSSTSHFRCAALPSPALPKPQRPSVPDRGGFSSPSVLKPSTNWSRPDRTDAE